MFNPCKGLDKIIKMIYNKTVVKMIDIDLFKEIVGPDGTESSLNELARIYQEDPSGFKEILTENPDLVEKILTLNCLLPIEHFIGRVIRQLDRKYESIFSFIKKTLEEALNGYHNHSQPERRLEDYKFQFLASRDSSYSIRIVSQ